jgi:hypothetical protein
MKRVFLLPLLISGLASGCTTSKPLVLNAPTVVETACGECQFGMKGHDCDLAVRIAGRAYFVDGVHIDSLGNAHSTNGLCNAVRQAKVTGSIQRGRFVATRFTLLPEDGTR